MNRPSWDEYFLMMAFVVSTRSDDQFIKHESVIVDNDTKYVLGTGYNNTISGGDLSVIPIQNRQARRVYMIHSEENSILNCATHPSRLKHGASIYVTGLPCINCLQRIINFKIGRIVMADRVGSIDENDEIRQIRTNLIKMSRIVVDLISVDRPWVRKVCELGDCYEG